MEDLELILRFLDGNEGAFQTLMERYLQPVYGFIFSYVHEQQQAEDIVQETFLKVWNNLDNFDRDKSFKVWLFTIAKHTALDFLRKKKMLSFSTLVEENEIFDVVDESPLPSALFERADLARVITEALEKLDAPSREVLVLYYKNHFNFREISDILGESLNTVKSRHRRALIKLKEYLAPNDL